MSFMKPTIASSRNGFTLIELLVVLILIAITAATVIPRVGAHWKRMGEKEFMQELVRTLRRGRLQAMNEGQPVQFTISGADRVYGLGKEPDTKIPEGVSIYAEQLDVDPESGDHYLLFYPDGSQTGSELQVFFGEDRSYRIHIHPLFGTVQWEKE